MWFDMDYFRRDVANLFLLFFVFQDASLAFEVVFENDGFIF